MSDYSEVSERDKRLKSMLSQASYNHEDAAILLIKISSQSLEYFFSNQTLVDKFIEDKEVPEEIAQRLLRMKVISLLEKEAYKPALHLLKNLESSEYRLACNTIEFYKLLLLEAQVFIAQCKYDKAYDYLGKIKDNFLETDECRSLRGYEELFEIWIRKIAIAAHLAKKNIAYDYFKHILQNLGWSLPVIKENKMLYFSFANECIRQEKYNEASHVFSELFKLEKENRSRSLVPGKLFYQVTAMVIISKLLDRQSLDTVKEELAIMGQLSHSSQDSMSDHLNYLMKRVHQLTQKIQSSSILRDGDRVGIPLYCPRYEGASLVDVSISKDLMYSDDLAKNKAHL